LKVPTDDLVEQVNMVVESSTARKIVEVGVKHVSATYQISNSSKTDKITKKKTA
jgi:hypothetical protein